MSPLTSVSSAPAYLPAAAVAPAASAASTASTPSSPSTSSTTSSAAALGVRPPAPALSLYSADGRVTAPAVWEQRQDDPLSARLARNLAASDTAGRWSGLGKALLDQASVSSSVYSQSVLLSATAAQGDDGVHAILRDQLHRFASQRIALTLTTNAGARIDVQLGANAEGVAVDFKVSQGSLSDEDRAAVTALGEAFDQAIQGLAGRPPTLALDKLMQFDTHQLAALDFTATLGDDLSLQLQIDGSQRSVTAHTAAGAMKVGLDATAAPVTGSAQQRQRAIASYLEQFDAAARRGQGDAGLMALFKDAFAQLHASATAPVQDHTPALLAADATDRGMLSGLGDFSASITGNSAWPNPLRRDEVDGFDYQVSQRTSLSGAGQADRSIVQQAQSRLKASYHQSLQPDLPLQLDSTRQSQNYTYHQIDDRADSQLEIGYRHGFMTQARLRQSASQDSRVSKYVLGELVSQTHTPLQAQIVRDFAAQLQDGKEARAADGAYRRSRLLDGISELGLLQSDPQRVRAHGAQWLTE
ncbi:hypothetical protein [Herbaspirillum seropedicae]|uniref:hypothetical protein n=1 Tax=Herbaspirillum seropedicae TaxID=964 RepID=UPI003D95CF2C